MSDLFQTPTLIDRAAERQTLVQSLASIFSYRELVRNLVRIVREVALEVSKKRDLGPAVDAGMRVQQPAHEACSRTVTPSDVIGQVLRTTSGLPSAGAAAREQEMSGPGI